MKKMFVFFDGLILWENLFIYYLTFSQWQGGGPENPFRI